MDRVTAVGVRLGVYVPLCLTRRYWGGPVGVGGWWDESMSACVCLQ